MRGIDYLDARELHSEFENLDEDYRLLQNAVSEAEDGDGNLTDAQRELEEWQNDNEDRHTELKNLFDDIGDAWKHEVFVNEDDFAAYAEELASDIYDLKDHWPYDCIDWQKAADALRQDYTTTEFEGTTYLFRYT